jgi:pyridoxal phosphate enzyme (YggS family)
VAFAIASIVILYHFICINGACSRKIMQKDRLLQRWRDVSTQLSQAHVRLLAVSKYTSDHAIEILLHAGQTDFAESKPQNLRDRASVFSQAKWHFIGPLQKNKAKYVGRHAAMWHSLCDIDVAKAVAKHVQGRVLPVLIQVNISGESQKQGVAPEALEPLYQALQNLPELQVIGLMGMAAKHGDAGALFSHLRELRDDMQQKYGKVYELGMGMSGDWEIAVREGATMVRLGSTLFAEYLPENSEV